MLLPGEKAPVRKASGFIQQATYIEIGHGGKTTKEHRTLRDIQLNLKTKCKIKISVGEQWFAMQRGTENGSESMLIPCVCLCISSV